MCDGYAAEVVYCGATPSCASLTWGYICLAAMPPCLSAAVCLRAALRLQWYGYFGNYADVVAVNVGITDFIFMLIYGC